MLFIVKDISEFGSEFYIFKDLTAAKLVAKTLSDKEGETVEVFKVELGNPIYVAKAN